MNDVPAIFALSETQPFAERVAAELRLPLGEIRERSFEDGEHKNRPMESVRGRDVFVVQSLHGDDSLSVNDKLCRLLFLIRTLKDAAAARVTAVLPYLCYARKDRQTKTRDPVTTRYVAMLFEAVGVDRVLTIDVHNLAAYQNAFRCVTEHLEARLLFAEHLLQRAGDEEIVVVSPDAGGVKRATAFRETLATATGRDVPLAFLEKKRSAGVVSGDAVVGPIEGRVAVIVDDLIADACQRMGATRIFAMATHGVFSSEANDVFADADALESVLITNTVPLVRMTSDRAKARLKVLDIAPLFAEAIRRMHTNESLVELMSDDRLAQAQRKDAVAR